MTLFLQLAIDAEFSQGGRDAFLVCLGTPGALPLVVNEHLRHHNQEILRLAHLENVLLAAPHGSVLHVVPLVLVVQRQV